MNYTKRESDLMKESHDRGLIKGIVITLLVCSAFLAYILPLIASY